MQPTDAGPSPLTPQKTSSKATLTAAVFIVLALVTVLAVVFLRGYDAMRASSGLQGGPGFAVPVADHAEGLPTSAEDPYLPDLLPGYAAPPPTGKLPVAGTKVIVSLTFDDGFDSQMAAANMLDEHEFPGTFYVNSGSIGKPGYLTLGQLRDIAEAGHEIGGHSVSHTNLPTLDAAEIQREICLDRKILTSWGFSIRNFAYPFAATNADTLSAAMACGYNTARGLGALENRFGCPGCPTAETIPPKAADLTAAPSNVTDEWTLDDLKDAVQKPQLVGGWVQLTFHRLCTTDCDHISIKESIFQEFLSWLKERTENSNIVVRSVEQVIGGPVQPLVEESINAGDDGGPSLKNASIERLVPPPAELPDNVRSRGRLPECWETGSTGGHQVKISTVHPGHHGDNAALLEVDGYVDGEAKLAQSQDLGTCAPRVSADKTYELRASYTSTAPTQFSVSYRLERGIWVYWTSSPMFPATDEYAEASWITPPIPEGVTAISFGLALQQEGELITDDYMLRDAASQPAE